MNLRVEKWGTRYWAVFDGASLVCVTLYKKGALEVVRRLQGLTYGMVGEAH